MIYLDLAIGLIIGLFLFLCMTKAYIIGISHGKDLSKGNVPKLDLNPVKAVSDVVQVHKAQKKQEEAIDDLETLMGYTAETALKAIKKGK